MVYHFNSHRITKLISFTHTLVDSLFLMSMQKNTKETKRILMSDNTIKIIPQHMTATSVLITPDRAETIITFYRHEFEHHMQSDEQGKNSFQVKVELTPNMSVSMSPDQAVALVKSLQVALRDNGLWKD